MRLFRGRKKRELWIILAVVSLEKWIFETAFLRFRIIGRTKQDLFFALKGYSFFCFCFVSFTWCVKVVGYTSHTFLIFWWIVVGMKILTSERISKKPRRVFFERFISIYVDFARAYIILGKILSWYHPTLNCFIIRLGKFHAHFLE